MKPKTYQSSKTPMPVGTYSQSYQIGGFIFLAGQTPRDVNGHRHGDKPFAVQTKMALDNLEAAANEAGSSLRNAVKVNVFLKRPADAQEFDTIYAGYVGAPAPARTLIQSGFEDFDLEVDAILHAVDCD